MSLDNSLFIAPFAPEKADGDTFIYTEMLDRGKKKGNNGHRLVKTFYHRSQKEFWDQWPSIKKLCDLTLTRACTRVAPRSYKKVGKEFCRLVVETALTENWAGMKSLYNRACGIAKPNQKLFLFDVDVIGETSEALRVHIEAEGNMVAIIPSKKGQHFITKPFNTVDLKKKWGVDDKIISLHRDNPTNLYVPEGAD